ncbi:transposase [Tenacibaculum dicentrarchi]|uniref:transposase n=1 Tax=Tenacibaculum dicentrarchi TaxID=669041 RepID=UPI00351480DA
MEKFNNKYRIPSARLQNWDYGNNGAYFITICTAGNQHFFGDIKNKELHFNNLGKLAEKYWLEIPNRFSFITLGNFVIMPNHMHGILIIDKFSSDISESFVQTQSVETRLIASLPPDSKIGGITGNTNPMFHQNISRIIRWYKGRCTYEIRKIHTDFSWQPRFYDHIIRNSKAFDKIQNYIENNPVNWNEDKFYR